MRFHRALSLRSKITASFTVIVIGGTAVSILIGSQIITTALIDQAQNRARRALEAAHTLYAERLGDVQALMAEAASAPALRAAAETGKSAAAADAVRCRQGLDFCGFVDAAGRVFPTSSGSAFSPRSLPFPISRALHGNGVAATEVLPVEFLHAASAALAERARIHIFSASGDATTSRETTDGLVLMASVPVRGERGVLGAVYGGVLLNRNDEIVDRVKRLLYGGETYQGRTVGTVSIFLRDVRVCTNVITGGGRSATGTTVSRPVAQAVLEKGGHWNGRAFVVDDWYVASYEPIKDSSGSVVGILSSGILEQPFLAARTQVMLTFLVVCMVGLIVVFVLTYVLTRTTIYPLEEMAAAARQIAAGHHDVRVDTRTHDEVGVLAASFNDMLDVLRAKERELENWALTLEAKVQERTDELVAVQARMARSEKLASIGRLAAGVAHGINNPLGGILTLSMLALEDCGADHPLRGDLETIVRQTERCREIVKGLLDFSRQSDARASKVSVNAVIDGSLSLLERQALFHNIKTVRRLADGLPPVFVDPGQLQEVIINIVLNAIDAMEEKGVVTIETGMDDERGQILIRITDTGKGIPPDVLPLIFEPFFTTKKVGQGTGLGLAIVHGMVTQAGGDVDVTSRPGETTFTVRLPVVSEEAGEAVG